MIFGMPKVTFWLTICLGLALFVPTVTDMSDITRFWWALVTWTLFAVSFFFLVKDSEIPWRTPFRVGTSFLAAVLVVALGYRLLSPQWKKAYPPAPKDVDQVGHIEHLLAAVPDSSYRQLVAAVIYAFEPNSTLSVGALENTPDGIRSVDIELRSVHDGKPTLAAIDVIDLPSGRKADVTSVDAADSKRLDIKADAMLLCSNTGFEADAISKAKRKKIGLISVIRQGDNRIKAVIEEEIYLRTINLTQLRATWGGSDLQNLNPDPRDLEYNGGSVGAWLEIKASETAVLNPELDFEVTDTFHFKEPTHFYKNGKRITLTSAAVSFTPNVQWLSQIVQLDAKTGIYDYVRGRVRLAGGENSYTVRGINFAKAKPLSSPPPMSDLGIGLMPGEFDGLLAYVTGPVPSEGTVIAKLDDLVMPEDLNLKMSPKKLEQLKIESGRTTEGKNATAKAK